MELSCSFSHSVDVSHLNSPIYYLDRMSFNLVSCTTSGKNCIMKLCNFYWRAPWHRILYILLSRSSIFSHIFLFHWKSYLYKRQCFARSTNDNIGYYRPMYLNSQFSMCSGAERASWAYGIIIAFYAYVQILKTARTKNVRLFWILSSLSSSSTQYTSIAASIPLFLVFAYSFLSLFHSFSGFGTWLV